MGRAWRLSGSLLASTLLLGACANIIGITDYEIDPSLAGAGGGAGTSGSAGMPSGGSTNGGSNGGNPQGGSSQAGTTSGGSSGQAGSGGSGGGGACTTQAECNDDIDCTMDSCTEGLCANVEKNARCESDVGECLVCQAGIGCVPSGGTAEQLLLDNNFDESSLDWFDGTSSGAVLTSANAHTPQQLAQFGPNEVFGLLYQYVTIPANTVKLTLSGYYQLLPGGVGTDAQDNVRVILYDNGVTELHTFHEWKGNDPQQPTWQSFSYDAPSAQLAEVVGGEVSLDFEAETEDSIFRFDTLSLTATTCN